MDITVDLALLVDAAEWKALESLLEAGAYTNRRWTLERRDGRLTFRRLPGAVMLSVDSQDANGGVRLGPVQVSAAEDLRTEHLAAMVPELVADAVSQGQLFVADVTFAVVGDVHGQMDLMTRTVREEESRLERSFSFVLQVGDFMPVRGPEDLTTVYAPKKYKVVGDFPAYHRGEKRFPWPVFFVGGNHEPYGFLETLEAEAASTGYARICDNVHYLGRAGWLERLGVNAAGLSGIFGEGAFRRARPAETSPSVAREFRHFNEADLANVHYTVDSVFEEAGFKADLLLLHDWPAGLVPEEELLAMDRKYGELRDPSSLRWAAILPSASFVCCGHHHVRRLFQNGDGGPVVVCLADITRGRDAVAVFRKHAGRLHLLEGARAEFRPGAG